MAILLSELDAGVLVVRLNRPGVRNALNEALRHALFDALRVAEQDPKVKAVVLTGAGKAFCSGLDLADLAQISDKSTEENRADSEQFAALLAYMYAFPKPLLAAVNGHAIAGGAGLASVCDVTVMSDSAKLGYTEARIGFVAALVSVFLVRQIGEKHARDLLLTARLISAQEALSMHACNEVVPAEQVLARTTEIARLMAANAPSSLAMTKKLLSVLPGMGLEEGLRYATELNALSRTTADLKEGVQAFLEKRAPNWQMASKD